MKKFSSQLYKFVLVFIFLDKLCIYIVINALLFLSCICSIKNKIIPTEIIVCCAQGHVVNYSEFMTAEEICENSTKLITFIDLAGHRKYLRTTVLGLTGYSPHHVMLVVSGSAGIVGMTHEHLALAIALDVPFFITITKTDVTSPADTLISLEAMLKSAGCRKVSNSDKNAFFVESGPLYIFLRMHACVCMDIRMLLSFKVVLHKSKFLG